MLGIVGERTCCALFPGAFSSAVFDLRKNWKPLADRSCRDVDCIGEEAYPRELFLGGANGMLEVSGVFPCGFLQPVSVFRKPAPEAFMPTHSSRFLGTKASSVSGGERT
jgi:hypothetical protein